MEDLQNNHFCINIFVSTQNLFVWSEVPTRHLLKGDLIIMKTGMECPTWMALRRAGIEVLWGSRVESGEHIFQMSPFMPRIGFGQEEVIHIWRSQDNGSLKSYQICWQTTQRWAKRWNCENAGPGRNFSQSKAHLLAHICTYFVSRVRTSYKNGPLKKCLEGPEQLRVQFCFYVASSFCVSVVDCSFSGVRVPMTPPLLTAHSHVNAIIRSWR